MNQDQVKAKLLRIEGNTEEFSLIFSGKSSKRANGVYHPEKREIIIHNRNFDNDNALIYTAIHEFAHHIHFCSSPVPISSRAHTTEYRNILHRLLARAEKKGVYRNIFEEEKDFIELTKKIRKEFLETNGRLMKDLGALFIQAENLCRKHGARFEDYIERVLRLERKNAETIMKIHAFDLPPSIGYENMRTLAGIRKEEERAKAQQAFFEGQTPDMVKAEIRKKGDPAEENPVEKLVKEKQRIERTISSLQEKLKEIETRIEEQGGEN